MKPEKITMAFRGGTRTFPVESFATAFRVSRERAIEVLEVLVFGPPEHRPPRNAPPAQPTVVVRTDATQSDKRTSSAPPRGQHEPHPSRAQVDSSDSGGRGGALRSDPNDNDTSPSVALESHARNEDVTEHTSDEEYAIHLARALDDMQNLPAIERLVREHPIAVLEEALRRTLKVPLSRVRGTRGALFTGIVRRLARSGAPPSHS